MTLTLMEKDKKMSKRAIQVEVEDITRFIRTFKTLLDEETTALRKADYKTVDGLQEKKMHFAEDYRTLVEKLNARRDELPGVSLQLRENLIRARTEFTLTLTDNLRALEDVKLSSQRLVNRIVESARDAVKETPVYSRHGKPSAGNTKAPVSIKIDQTL